MAVTEFARGSAFAVQRWSAELAHEAIGGTFFKRFLGDGQDACIRHIKDLERGAGELIKYDVRYLDRNPGVQGDTKLEGFESGLQFYQDEVYVDQLRQGHSFRGMTQQRSVHDLRREGRASLSEWWARVYDALMFHYLAGVVGNSPEAVGGILGTSGFAGNPLQAPDAAHLINGSAGTFNLGLVDRAVAKAKTVNPRVRPVMVDGKPKYCLVMHPWSVLQMKRQAGANEWNLIHQNASQRSGSNPIYTGALGEYNGVVLHESEYVPVTNTGTLGDGNGTIHNVFLGAGAGVFAMGNAWDKSSRSSAGNGSYFRYSEEVRDHGNEKSVGSASIFGMTKCRFNGADFGCIRVDSNDDETP